MLILHVLVRVIQCENSGLYYAVYACVLLDSLLAFAGATIFSKLVR